MASRLLTKQELKILVPELAERCRDMVDATAEDEIKKLLSTYAVDFGNTQKSITINYTLMMCVGDLIQILSRHERMKRRVKA